MVFVSSMANLIYSFTLNCNFQFLKDLTNPSKYLYACEAINVTIRSPTTIDFVTNLHHPGQRDKDVRIFIIKHNLCHNLPLKIEKFFPNLSEIEVSSSELKMLHRDNFASLTKLTMGIFSENDLEHLPGDLFIYNSLLTHIDFSQNRIVSVGHNFFNSLYNLKYLLFEENICFNSFELNASIELVKKEILKSCSNVVNSEQRNDLISLKVDEDRKNSHFNDTTKNVTIYQENVTFSQKVPQLSKKSFGRIQTISFQIIVACLGFDFVSICFSN
ncbi:CLUMA_CG020159, isoform A [Clunio marinus]|uniref:CLUMA_CG020159, isoform A n=1 Tax=Clunio marinus TaxID=568069 RepID=A0A1J1J440_9DIPT|nr:CLUMA_CG020159, isoform A [Clunio marinus]